MVKEELNKLIKELEDLQIQQEAVIKKIRRASTEEAPRSADRPTQSTPQDNKAQAPSFHEGQRVLIKNRITHVPFTRRTSIKDRAGTITKITRKRIHIKTCNGEQTSRASHNVSILTEEEYHKATQDS